MELSPVKTAPFVMNVMTNNYPCAGDDYITVATVTSERMATRCLVTPATLRQNSTAGMASCFYDCDCPAGDTCVRVVIDARGPTTNNPFISEMQAP